MPLCVVYVVKEVASFWGTQGIHRTGHVVECALELYRPARRKILVPYVETNVFCLKYIPNVLQEPTVR